VEISLSLLQFALSSPLNRDLGVQEHDKYNVQSLNTEAVAFKHRAKDDPRHPCHSLGVLPMC